MTYHNLEINKKSLLAFGMRNRSRLDTVGVGFKRDRASIIEFGFVEEETEGRRLRHVMAKDGEDHGLRAILYERGSLKLLDQRVIPYEVSS